MNAQSPADTPAGLSGAELRLFALSAVLAAVGGRAVSPALPGSSAGIAAWIVSVERLSAILSQLAAVIGSLLVMRLLSALRQSNRLGALYWLIALPAGIAVSLVIAAMQNTLAPQMTLGLGTLSALVALMAAPYALARTGSRAVGLVLFAAGASALVHIASRVVAVSASERALGWLFDVARNLATLGFSIDVLSVVLGLLWLCSRRLLVFGVIVALLSVSALAVCFFAERGTHYDATLAQVLLARSLAELIRHPAPFFVSPWIREALELVMIVVALSAAAIRRRSGPLQVALGLALLARASADIPAYALLLIVAALLSAFGSFDLEPRPS